MRFLLKYMKQDESFIYPGNKEDSVSQWTKLPNIFFIINLFDKRFSGSGSMFLEDLDVISNLTKINSAILSFLGCKFPDIIFDRRLSVFLSVKPNLIQYALLLSATT